MSLHVARCSKSKFGNGILSSPPIVQASHGLPSLTRADSESMDSSMSDLTADHAVAGVSKRRTVVALDRRRSAENAAARARRAESLQCLLDGAPKRALGEIILSGKKYI